MATVRRVIKHKVGQYTPAQIRVRDATSNDAGGPTPSQLDAILEDAEDIFQQDDVFYIIWKRLNDDGKNWRHVYKSLKFLEHVLRHGSRRVIEQVMQQPIAVTTLKNFQFVDKDGIDQGRKVRDAATTVDSLIREARVKNQEFTPNAVATVASSPELGMTFAKARRSPSVTALSGADNYGSIGGGGGAVPRSEEEQIAQAIAESQQLAEEDRRLRQLDAANLDTAKSLSLGQPRGNVAVQNSAPPTVQVDPWGVQTGAKAASPVRDPWGVVKEATFSDSPAFGALSPNMPPNDFASVPFSPVSFTAFEVPITSAAAHHFATETIETRPNHSGTLTNGSIETRPNHSGTTTNSLDDVALTPSPAVESVRQELAASQKSSFLDQQVSGVVDLDNILNENFNKKSSAPDPAVATLNAMRVPKPACLPGDQSQVLASPLIPLAETRCNSSIARGTTWMGPPGAQQAVLSGPNSPGIPHMMMQPGPAASPAMMPQPAVPIAVFGSNPNVQARMPFSSMQMASLGMQSSTQFATATPAQPVYRSHSNPFFQ